MPTHTDRESKVQGGVFTPVDVNKLPMPRLKAYRRKLKAILGGMEICDCGDSGCTQMMHENKDNRYYKFIKAENEKADIEFGNRCRAEAIAKRKKNWAYVPAAKQKA
jgi:hypothetical protein